MSKLIILMGVSGCGKTTVGKLLANQLKIPFLDADDFHPQENITKMASGKSLNDSDRKPWLTILNNELIKAKKNTGVVLACSALKEIYREILAKENPNIHWFYLEGSFELIKKRLDVRTNHFMSSSLLQSQFDCLEIPVNATKIDIKKTPEFMVEEIKKTIHKASFGVFGLGVMGKSLTINMLNNNFSIAVFNRDEGEEKGIIEQFVKENNNKELQGYINLEAFVNSLAKPRKILMMVKAGEVTDAVIDSLVPFLDKEDILIDGGNSHYKDTNRREKALNNKNINFIGLGVSGGEEGALKGPSLMPGGNKESYKKVANFLETIAAKDEKGNPCCNYIGKSGSGHFVKMVHNGIEYGDMQLLAEMYDLLSKTTSYDEISSIFNKWNKGSLSSYLLEITTKILKEKEDDEYVLDQILDKAGNKGTGSWSSIAALQLGIPTTLKTAAVNARYTSSFKEKRVALSKYKKEKNAFETVALEKLKAAYDFARTINLHQGLALIKTASDTYNWNLNLAEICNVWSNGCIIKSEKIKVYANILNKVDTLLEEESVVLKLYKDEVAITEIIAYALKSRIQIPCFYEAYNYWIAMTTEKSSANLIQAQRDFFGAHRFQKVNENTNKTFHYNWS